MSGTRSPSYPAADPALLKTPPQNLEAEQAVLASILLNNDLMNGVVEVLRPEDFYQGAHRALFSAMLELYERGRAIDPLTIAEALRGKDGEAGAGGVAYLSELIAAVPTIANAMDYARMVKEKAILRRTIAVSQEIAASAYQGVTELDEFLDRTEQAIFAIAEEKIKPSYYSMSEMSKEAMKEIEKLYEKKELVTGIPSGFRDLDSKTAGFQRSDMIVVAARPGMGKTALCLNVALNAALRDRIPVAIFSLEMSRQQLALRMICSEARVEFQRLRTGYLTQDEINRIVAAVGKLSEAPIYTDDSGALSALELRAKARRLKKDKGIGLVVVDYLQLMRGSATRGNQESRVQEISEISRSIKALAKELDIPVIAISQLNRGVESRNDKRPQMADLRECVTGDTLVLCTDGTRAPIRSLVGKAVEVWALSPEGRIVPAKSDLVWPVGTRPVVRIGLAGGRTLRATSDHRLYGANGWVRVSDLSPGDRLALARRIPPPRNPVRWPNERVILLGHLVGGGGSPVRQPMRVSSSSEENLRIVGGAACRELGIFGRRSHEKRLPAEVFRFDDEQVGLLLRHLWAADGSIPCRPPARKGSSRVCFGTASHGLAFDVASLLLRLGIVARIRSVREAGDRPVYTVDVSGAGEQKRFLETVGAFGPRVAPADALREELAFPESDPDVEPIPKEIFPRVRESMAAQGISGGGMAGLRQTACGGSSRFGFAPSRCLPMEDATLPEDESLRQTASSDIFWDRVTDIRPDGTEEVFDLTVPGPSSWLADGVVSHNSGAIEQDSDLILFIYREEMYDRENEEKKGKAEVIIGKQRNGPMGVVELAFLSRYTRFEDLAREYE